MLRDLFVIYVKWDEVIPLCAIIATFVTDTLISCKHGAVNFFVALLLCTGYKTAFRYIDE
jgi:hypothetical protein